MFCKMNLNVNMTTVYPLRSTAFGDMSSVQKGKKLQTGMQS